MRKIVINGTALSTLKNVSGIPRFCRELILRLDRLFGTDYATEYLYLDGAENSILGLDELKNIVPVAVKSSKHLMALNLKEIPKYLKKQNALCINFAPEAVNRKGQIVTIYDLRPVLFDGGDSFKTKLKYKINLRFAKKKSRKILTDSYFQKQQIVDYLKVDDSRISVIYCGWEHINDIKADNTILEKIGNKSFYYALGSIAPNKNYRWILEIAKRNPDCNFIIAGQKYAVNNNYFVGDVPKNVEFIGYVTDGENKALMSHCKAFLFPSKYEGFGLPPLEALACGAPIIISNASCLPEVYEDSAHYVDPDDYEVDLDKILAERVGSPEKILKKCSWDVAAEKVFDILKECIAE